MPEQKKLTLAEIAEIYRVSPKTFSRDVRKKGIPHSMVGRRMLFELSAVEAYLAVKAEIESPRDNVRPFRRRQGKGKTNKFAEAVGI